MTFKNRQSDCSQQEALDRTRPACLAARCRIDFPLKKKMCRALPLFAGGKRWDASSNKHIHYLRRQRKRNKMVQDSCFLRCCCIFQVLIFLEFSVYISCMFPMPILWVSYHSSTCCRVICFLSRPQHEKTEKKGGEGEDKSSAGPCSGAGDDALFILNLPSLLKEKIKLRYRRCLDTCGGEFYWACWGPYFV